MKDPTDLRIVVVEDDPNTLSLFGTLLERLGYSPPVLLDSCLKAVEFLHRCDAAALIVDIVLPEMSGIELLRHVSEVKPHLPVIVVSGLGQIDTAIECMKMGAFDYLTKPLDVTRLEQSLARALTLRQQRDDQGEGAAAEQERADGETVYRVPDGVPERLANAAAYMAQHLSDPLYLDTVAREACLSKFHFCREFNKHFGIPPMQFMLQRRIAQAVDLMEDAESSISQVAMQCGFSDQSEFTKWFKKATGQTPSSYRNAARRRMRPPGTPK